MSNRYKKNEKNSLNYQLCKKNLFEYYNKRYDKLERSQHLSDTTCIPPSPSFEKENVNATSIVPETSTELNETSESVETSSTISVSADSIAKPDDSSLDSDSAKHPQDILPSSLCPSPVEGSVSESSLVVESYPIESALPDSSPVEVTAPDSIPLKASIKDQILHDFFH